MIEKLPSLYSKDFKSSKIFFGTIYKEPSAFLQRSKKFEEDNYIIQYEYTDKISEEISPALFIFLIDQSGSMKAERMEITKKALEIFLQSLPSKSYYQLIGFGSNYKKYHTIPKEYTQKNINKTLRLISSLKANLGSTEIYEPLKEIYKSNEIYDKINLSRKIFLLTDGFIDSSKKETLNLIKENNSKFRFFSIDIGGHFDEDLIEKSGLFGKDGYNFCKYLDGLSSIIVREINNANSPWVSDFNIKCLLDKDNLIATEKHELVKNNDILIIVI